MSTNKLVDKTYLKKFHDVYLPKMEGRLYSHIYMTRFGEDYFVSRELYTVKNGVVWMVLEDRLTLSGDTLYDIHKDCKRIGMYNPETKYKFSTHKRFSYGEIKGRLGL